MLQRFFNRRGTGGYSPVAEAERMLLEHELELSEATQTDSNLTRLMASDPDAAVIFDPGDFTRCLHDPDYGYELGRRLEAYAAAKHAAGRMDLYYQLFA